MIDALLIYLRTAAMDEACKNGHLEVVEWLHQNRQEGCTGGAMDMAASHGHLEVSKIKIVDFFIFRQLHNSIIRFFVRPEYIYIYIMFQTA